MTINVTTTKNTVTVNGDTQVVKVNSQGPQGPSFPDGNLGDVTSSNTGTTVTVNAGAIDNANIASDAAIDLTKLATGTFPTGLKINTDNILTGAVTTGKIATGTIINGDISLTAAIAGSKIDPSFTSNIVTTGQQLQFQNNLGGRILFSDSNNNPDYRIESSQGKFQIDQNNATNPIFKINSDGHVDINNNLDCGAGIDITGDLTTTGDATIGGGDLTLQTTGAPALHLVDLNHNSDFTIRNFDGTLEFRDSTNNANRLTVASNGLVTVVNDLTVTGNFTVNGTTTTIDTTTLTVEDKNIELGKVSTPTDTTADGGGLTLKGATDKTFQWLDATDSWTSSEHIALPDDKKLQLGANQDLEIFHSGNLNVIGNKTTPLEIRTDNFSLHALTRDENFMNTFMNNRVELFFDDSKKFQTTANGITAFGTSHVLTSGTSGDCELIIAADSDNNNENDNPRLIFRQDGSLTANSIGINHPNGNDNNDLYIANGGFAGDIGFYTGYDSNNQNNYTAATERLRITTDGNVQIPNDTGKLQLGASADLQLFHNGTNSIIQDSGQGNLELHGENVAIRSANGGEVLAGFTVNGAVELFFNNFKKLETTSTGASVTGNLGIGTTSPARDLSLHSGDASSIFAHFTNTDTGTTATDGCIIGLGGSEDLVLNNQETGKNIIFENGGSERLRITSDGNLQIPNDNQKLQIGASDDLEIYHDSSHSYIEDSGTGELRLKSNLIRFQGTNGEPLAVFEEDSAVALYFDNSIKFNTNALGVRFIGHLRGIDNEKIQLGASQDLELFHDGSNSHIKNATGHLIFKSDNFQFKDKESGDEMVKMLHDGAVELYFDNSKKFETTSTGATITGSLQCTLPDAHNEGITLQQESSKAVRFLSNAFRSGASQGLLSIQSAWTGTPVATIDTVTVGSTSSKGAEIKFKTVNAGGSLTERLKITSDGNVQILQDTAKLQIGAGQDLEIYHSGTDSYIDQDGTGHLFIRGNGTNGIHLRPKQDEDSIKCHSNGAVELYFDNSKKLETTSTGVKVTSNSGDISVVTDSTGSALSLINPQNLNNSDVKFGSNYGHFSVFTGGLSGSEKFAVRHDANVRIPNDTGKLQIGAGQDLELFHGGTNSLIRNNTGGGTLFIQGNGDAGKYVALQPKPSEDGVVTKPDAGTELYYDNSKKLETSSDGIVLTGAARFVGNETGFLAGKAQPTIYRTASLSGSYPFDAFGHLIIQSRNDSSNRDIIFATGTSSSKLNRITSDGHLDIFGDNQKLRIGASQDLQLLHNGSDSFVRDLGTGGLYMTGSVVGIRNSAANEDGLLFAENAAVQLYFDNSKKLETTANGVNLVGTQQNFEGVVKFDNNINAGMDMRWEPSSNSLDFLNNVKARFGANNDLQIYHDGSNSYINNTTGTLFYLANTHYFTNPAVSEIQATFVKNDAVKLYYDNSKKFETTSYGVLSTEALKVEGDYVLLDNSSDSSYRLSKNGTALFSIRNNTVNGVHLNTQNSALLCLGVSTGSNSGTVASTLSINSSGNVGIDNQGATEKLHLADNKKLAFGNGADLKIYHDGSNSFIDESSGVGSLYTRTNAFQIQKGAGVETMAQFLSDGAVNLYYDNSKKFETTSTGATVTTTSAANSIKNITTSTSAPSGGSDGDLWFTYIA